MPADRKHIEEIALRKARAIARALRRMNFIYEKKDMDVQTVSFLGVFIQDGKAYLPIASVPRGIRMTRLIEDDVLQSLRMEVEKSLQFEEWGGRTCYSFRVGGAEFPASFSFNAFQWEKSCDIYGLSSKDIPPLSFPLGIDADRRHVWCDLDEVKHLLIAGTTGNGKSTIIHSLVTSIIQRISPQEILFYMGDPKRTELSLYRKLILRNGTGYVRRVETEPLNILEMLMDLTSELDRRQRDQERVGAVNLSEYIRSTGELIPHIIIILDEIADLIQNKEKADGKKTIGSSAELLLARIARQGRSSGVHLVASTQHPEANVLTSQIKANMGARIAFSTTDHWKSIVILDDNRSVGLPKGRAIFRDERMNFSTFQTCLINATQIKLIVDRVANGGHGGKRLAPDEQKRFLDDVLLLVETAMVHCQGEFAYKKIHSLLQGQIPRDRIQEIAIKLEQDNILKPGRGKRARVLYPIFQTEKRAELILSLYGGSKEEKTTAATIEPYQGRNVVVLDGEHWEAVDAPAGDAPDEDSGHPILDNFVYMPEIRKRRGSRFFSVRKWCLPTKEAGLHIFLQMKKDCDASILSLIAKESVAVFEENYRVLCGCVTSPPPGGSKPDEPHFATEIAKEMAHLLNIPYIQTFKPRYHKMGHFPQGKSRGDIPPLELIEEIPLIAPILLFDDLSSSGTTIGEASDKLAKYGMVFPIVWLAGESSDC